MRPNSTLHFGPFSSMVLTTACGAARSGANSRPKPVPYCAI